jgi:hypothetical protein
MSRSMETRRRRRRTTGGSAIFHANWRNGASQLKDMAARTLLLARGELETGRTRSDSGGWRVQLRLGLGGWALS